MRGGSPAWLLLAATTLACGGGGTTDPDPATPTPAPAVRTVIQTNRFADIPEGAVFRVEVDLVQPGTIDNVVDWTPGPNASVYVALPSCVSGRDAISGVCNRVAFANGPGRPKRVSFPNPRVETYYYYIHNEGPGVLTGTIETALTR